MDIGAQAPEAPHFSPPEELDEYRLVRFLGQGAMGRVYLYQDARLHRPVAVKFLIGAHDEVRLRDRFQVEAMAIARLLHPNIVAVYRFGEVAGCPFLASEFIQGRPLDKVTKPMPYAQLLPLSRGLAEGLAHAHQAGVLHRDIKPANIILSGQGEPKLVDFGLAKLAAAELAEGASVDAKVDTVSFRDGPVLPPTGGHLPLGITQSGALIGTPRYMAPEQWRGEPATARTDVYALGVVLYELAGGRRPHAEGPLLALGAAVLAQDAPALHTRAPTLDRRFAAVVDRCLRRDPEERFATGAELRQALCELEVEPGRAGGRRALLVCAGAAVLMGLALALSFSLRRPATPGTMVQVQGGTFPMGSTDPEIEAASRWCQRLDPNCPSSHFARERPQRQVRLSPYRMDVLEVTTEQFAAWLNRRPGLKIEEAKEGEKEIWVLEGPGAGVRLIDLYPSYTPSFGLVHQNGRFAVLPGFERRAVTQVTWHGALRYCQALGGRLPTEAEWEFAARGAEGRRFPWGQEDPRCDGVVFGRSDGMPCAHLGVHVGEVGRATQDQTPLGIRDLGGNVSEWVMDLFEEGYRPCGPQCLDPRVEEGAGPELRVFRGGDFAQLPAFVRAAGRARWEPEVGMKSVGFRCVAR